MLAQTRPKVEEAVSPRWQALPKTPKPMPATLLRAGNPVRTERSSAAEATPAPEEWRAPGASLAVLTARLGGLNLKGLATSLSEESAMDGTRFLALAEEVTVNDH